MIKSKGLKNHISNPIVVTNMRNLMLISTFLISLSMTMAANECVYDPRGFTFHCSNNMPGTEIGPGLNGSITITCCFTGKQYQDSDTELLIYTEIVNNSSYKQQNQDGSWDVISDIFPASNFITKVEYPNVSKGFTPFPVTIHYSLPENSPLYKPGELIPSRVDIRLIMPGGVIPNNAIYPKIRIPKDWTPSGFTFNPLLIAGVGMGLFSVLGFTVFTKKRKSSKMKKVLGKK